MSTLILCEKFNQAKEVRQVLGDRHGKIAAASGHLLRLQTPNEIDPRWAVPWTAWVPEAMLPDSGVYGYALAAEDPRRASSTASSRRTSRGAMTPSSSRRIRIARDSRSPTRS